MGFGLRPSVSKGSRNNTQCSQLKTPKLHRAETRCFPLKSEDPTAGVCHCGVEQALSRSISQEGNGCMQHTVAYEWLFLSTPVRLSPCSSAGLDTSSALKQLLV
ncbi:hypothetical protein UY3_06774 [Chelonia mydas]|uniref:Uncharacterized protein n=1 Tax=Chelonia mydas TaxID=8469 RepID=M7BJZ0_CHEMY|nr:hypothetical protein UY3_06774 [Chelonia mydas]